MSGEKKTQESWLQNSERRNVKKMWATSSISVQVFAQGNRQTKKNSGNVAINHPWKNYLVKKSHPFSLWIKNKKRRNDDTRIKELVVSTESIWVQKWD